jgi:hypothetical protein
VEANTWDSLSLTDTHHFLGCTRLGQRWPVLLAHKWLAEVALYFAAAAALKLCSGFGVGSEGMCTHFHMVASSC